MERPFFPFLFVRLSSPLSLSLLTLPSALARYSLTGETGLNDDQKSIWQMCSAFAEKEMMPHMAEWDEKEIFPVDTLRQLAELGFGAIYASDVRTTAYSSHTGFSFQKRETQRRETLKWMRFSSSRNDVAIALERSRLTDFLLCFA